MYKLTCRQSLFLRVYHWLLVVLVSFIVPTGFYLHHPVMADWLDFGLIFSLHVFAGFLLSYLLMARAYYALFNRDYQTVVFSWRDLRELSSLFKYYLFLRAEKPPARKYNSGQRMIWTSWFILLSLANISGAMAYKKTDFLPVAKLLGGFHHLDWFVLGTALFVAYTVPLHIYLSLTENSNFLQAMITGYAYTLRPGGCPTLADGKEKTRVRLPGKWLVNKVRALLK